MAVLLLQAAGAYLGGFFGASAGMLAGAAGAVAGYYLDQALINGTQTIEGQRLKGQSPFTAEEGGSPASRVRIHAHCRYDDLGDAF